MITESSLAHLPPFPFIQCKPFSQSSQKDQFPLFFNESLPRPSDLHAELPAHLTPIGGSSQKTQPNISHIVLISLAMTMTHQKKSILFLAVLMVSDSWRKAKLSKA